MGYKTASPDRYEPLKEFARENRKNPTMAEQVLWTHLRNNSLGVKFLRQHIIGDYITDFVSTQYSLIIEVDGAYHAEQEQIDKDENRTENLNKMGYKVIRFTNEEVLYNTKETIEKIIMNINMKSENKKVFTEHSTSSLPHREGRVGSTLFDKIWNSHIVQNISDGPTQLYIDRLYCHEVTSPQAFAGMRERGLKCFRPGQIFCMPDHNTPTHDQDKPIEDPVSKTQVDTLAKNAKDFGLTHFGMMDKRNGIIHVVGPERGLSLPGMTIVCGDSHTSTHGAMGAVAFGIGTSEVEMVLASQCILQQKPKSMRINVEGKLGQGVTAKDMALYLMSKLTTSGATGYFIEYAGEAVRALTMEGRLTLCNLSIEMGARGGFIAPDEVTFAYIKGREYAPKGEAWDKALAYWKTLKSDDDAVFDKELTFRAEEIEPMITYGTNPGMGMGISESIPTLESIDEAGRASFKKSLEYMDFEAGKQLLGKKIDYVFLGACTNGRIEDFRAFASIVKGRKKADNVIAWLVPGSWMVDAQIREEGLDKVLEEAGFSIRQPGCSACLAMNDDKVPAGKYAVSTSNRNFEGRQGPGSRTILASPLTAAACAVTGVITDPRELQ